MVICEVKSTRNIEEGVFLPLHTELARKTFIAGTVRPTVADWLLFALLFGKIVLIIDVCTANNDTCRRQCYLESRRNTID